LVDLWPMGEGIRKNDEYHLYTVTELLELQDDQSRWIVPHMIPRVGRTFVYGRGGEYKSAILFDLCIAVASAGQMLEQFPIQGYGPVILMSTESSIFENRLRLLAHMRSRNLNPEIVKLRYGQSRLKLDKKEGFEKLAAMVDEVQPIMLVLDPYISFMSGAENNANEVAQFTDGLDWLIEKYNLSVVVIHHANKSGELRGSSAIQGWCDALLKFESDRDVKLPTFPHPVRVVHVKGEKQRNGREGLLFSAVPMHNEAAGLITFGIYADAEGSGVVIAYLKQEIYHLLRDTGAVLTKTDIVNHFACSPDKVDAALMWLHRCGLVCPGNVERSTSADGTRVRVVAGWQALAGDSKVDVARVMLQSQRYDAEDDEDGNSD